jgi:hypothetical protein
MRILCSVAPSLSLLAVVSLGLTAPARAQVAPPGGGADNEGRVDVTEATVVSRDETTVVGETRSANMTS